MIWWSLVLGLILLFGAVVLYGAPYLPTKKAQQEAALDLLNLPKGATLYELGCGDGRMLKAAARRGLKVVGYELNPVLVAIAWLNTYSYRRQVKVVWGNYWLASFDPADGVYAFLIERFMAKFDKKLTEESRNKSIRVASFAFKIPGREPDAYKAGIYLYVYGPGSASPADLRR